MTKFKSKAIISVAALVLMIFTMQLTVFAANEKIEIVQKGTQEYIIYIKDSLKNDFQFAFSNNQDEAKEDLAFQNAAQDSTGEDANKIAYVNDVTLPMFENKTYMWVKNANDVYALEGVEVDLNEAISETYLNYFADITNYIPIDTSKTKTTEKTVGSTKTTTTVGVVTLTNPGDYTYVLVKADASESLANLNNLAKKISTFNSTTDMYTKVLTYREFSKAIVATTASFVDEDWKAVSGSEIEQPETAKDGEQYVLFISSSDGSIGDIHFLTSVRKESTEKVIETITTRLPVTYDNNVLLIVLAILVLLTIAVSIRIKMLSKKQEK